MPLTAEHGLLAIAVARSTNAKIGACATTYAAQESCPADCVFKDGGGCYAENGRIASGVTIPLNTAAERAHATALDVAEEEATALDRMKVVEGRPLRLHTVGDCATDETARIVSAAAARYMERGGGPVWTYTHAWRTVQRESWGNVSVLASCETAAACHAAAARGYAPSIVVEDFPDRRRYTLDTLDVVPCPAQTTEGVSCASCRLCMSDGKLLERGHAIGFAVHGTRGVVKAAVKALRDPDDPDRRLTSRDHAQAFRDAHGYWPSILELARLADVTKASAWEMLKRLREEVHA